MLITQHDRLAPASGEALSIRAAEFAAQSFGERTRTTYDGAWAGYVEWCAAMGRNPMDGDPSTVALYITCRADAGCAVSTIDVDLSAIASAHRLKGVPLDMDDARLRMVKQGIIRSIGRAPRRQAAPATVDRLRAMVASCKPTNRAAGARDRAMLLIGYGAAMRRSELVALRVGDVSHVRGRGLIVTIRRSKTDQDGTGETLAICANPADPEFCPAVAFERWMGMRREAFDAGAADRPLFCAVSKAGVMSCEPCNNKIVDRLVKSAAAAAGFDSEDFSGHSLRSGLATTAAENGKQLPDLMPHMRHRKAETTMRYVRSANQWTNNVTEGAFS